MDTSMYWDGHELLTRNAMFNFAIGGRGTGKTYFFKRSRIQHFIRTGKQFIYLRRYKSEFDDKSEFFKDVAGRFPEWEFKIEGMKGYMRKVAIEDAKPEKWRTVCFFVTLANALTKKSVPYPDVDMIGYDEFIIDKGALHYLRNEVKAFLDFYSTVDRNRDKVKVMFMANAVSIMNPYFIYYGLKPRKGTRFTRGHNGYMCVEYIQSEAFVKHVDSTRFGQMIKGTAYYDYAVSNAFEDDNDKFIAQKTPAAIHYFTIVFDGKTLACWVDYNDGFYYFNDKHVEGNLKYTLTRSDFAPNLLMLEKSSWLLKSVRKLFMQGSVFFNSVDTREFFYEMMDYLGMG